MAKYEIEQVRWRATFEAAGFSREQAQAVLVGDEKGLSDERALALLMIDADSIQRTLLASPRPVTIFGASHSLATWDKQVRNHHQLPNHVTVLYAGGGSAVLVVPKAEAEALGAQLELRYRDHMDARATSAFVEVSPLELVRGPRGLPMPVDGLSQLGLSSGGGGFGGCMSNLALALRARKNVARPHPYLASATDEARCVETGDRPREAGATRSRFASLHREAGQDQKQELANARSLDDILKKAKARRLAFVCIDGAKIGALLTELRTLADYVELSGRLDDAFSELRDESLRTDLGIEDHAHQIVLAGGDDLLLVVPAEGRGSRPNVLDLVAKIVRRIEAAFEGSRWARRIGVGAGVLITNGGLPARFAFDYARALCNSAKFAIRDGVRSGIDFEVVLSGAPLSTSIGALRKKRARTVDHFPKLGSHAELRDTQCPYSLEDFEQLLSRAGEVHAAKVGQSTLAAYTRAFERDDLNTALIDIYYQLARASSGDVLRRVLDADGRDPNTPSDRILRQSPQEKGVYATGLRDLVEVTKLMRRR